MNGYIHQRDRNTYIDIGEQKDRHICSIPQLHENLFHSQLKNHIL